MALKHSRLPPHPLSGLQAGNNMVMLVVGKSKMAPGSALCLYTIQYYAISGAYNLRGSYQEMTSMVASLDYYCHCVFYQCWILSIGRPFVEKYFLTAFTFNDSTILSHIRITNRSQSWIKFETSFGEGFLLKI